MLVEESDGGREVMDVVEAADYLGVARDTMYHYALGGVVPAFRLGNRWRFKRSLLDKWMTEESEFQGALRRKKR